MLSSTIKNYAYCSVAPRSDGKITVSREDQDVRYGPETIQDLKGGGEVEFVRAVAKDLTRVFVMTLYPARDWGRPPLFASPS